MTRNSGPSTYCIIGGFHILWTSYICTNCKVDRDFYYRQLNTVVTENKWHILYRLHCECSADTSKYCKYCCKGLWDNKTQFHDSKVGSKGVFCNRDSIGWMESSGVHQIVSGCVACYASVVLTKHDHCAFCGCYTLDFLHCFISSLPTSSKVSTTAAVCFFTFAKTSTGSYQTECE